MPIAGCASPGRQTFDWPSSLVADILANCYAPHVGARASVDAAREHEILLRGVYRKASHDLPFARERLLAKLEKIGIADSVVVDAELLVVKELLNLLSSRFRLSSHPQPAGFDRRTDMAAARSSVRAERVHQVDRRRLAGVTVAP